ncbi:MAG TPA: DUF4886 domain-containing protein [Rhodopirellula baltica]|uniref:DUF4886 domain-containing protein n=1 Tax=Rhodopirellula baltica (strain DSM 10527 / NCIMB 13988 / SH1) TaxID=243090 RepID=Q7UTC1_RHOBA|nr:DUF4886 domain-containing protein [Rhodopirellula baltica]CAD73516.1 hypothetical protein-signal peptide and transmembrane prediction [Rhodopirellula baltica SH 1]HBE66115.1 DUF4886 domain-containing protein [Rhodopirellula baltica]
MFRPFPFVCIFALISLIAGSFSYADSPKKPSDDGPKHVRILTIGNSFTHNATRYLDEIVEAAGHKLTHKMLSIGGSPLELHAKKALAFEKDPMAPFAKYGNGETLQEALQSEPWDFVTIQQVSIKSHNLETYHPYAQQLAQIIRRDAPQARLLVHQTWSYRSDDPRFRRVKLIAGEPATQREMYEGLSEAYRTITAELSANRIPVGDAFWAADNHAQFSYREAADFDAASVEFPELPDQTHSLHVGYRWREIDGKQQLKMDGHHANVAGEYLGACVWFECLYGETPIGNSFVPDQLDAEYAAHLQTIAHRAAQQGGDVVSGPFASLNAAAKD